MVNDSAEEQNENADVNLNRATSRLVPVQTAQQAARKDHQLARQLDVQERKA